MKKLIYLSILLTFLFIPRINVYADEIVDMSTWTTVSGRINSDNTMEYNSNKTYNNEVLLNPYSVFSGVQFSSGDDYFIRSSFWERNTDVWSPCNQASFTFNFWVLFNDQHSYVNYVKQIRFNDSVCDITGRDTNEGRVYASCIVPHKVDRWNDIFIDYNEFFNYPSTTSQIYISRYNRLTCALDTQSIITNDNANTQSIITNNSQNTQDIINNQDSNTQDIINNQNANSQAEIESQKVCNTFDKNSISIDNSFLTSNGSVYSQNSEAWGITDYINIYDSEVTVLTNYSSSYAHICYYGVNKELISCSPVNSLPDNSILNLPTNYYYFRLSIAKSYNRPSIRVCKNGNQALNDSVNDLNDTLNSEATPNTNQDIQDMEDMTASDTPISDLITMPLTLFNAYINGVNATCSPVNLGNLYGTNLILPCLNLEQRLGSNLWGIIDAFFSIFMCYNIGMLFITAFDGITSLRDDFEGLYQPRHADTGYQPKHGGGN